MTCVPDSGASIASLLDGSLEFGWQLYVCIAVLLHIAALTIIFYWSMDDWSNHPIVKDLSLYVNRGGSQVARSSWRIRGNEISNEYRRIDKYATSYTGWSRLIVTENWIMMVSLYIVRLVPQDQVTLAVMQSEEHDISPESNSMVQFLSLRIKPTVLPHLKPFYIRILSTEFKELKDAVMRSIVTLPNISILQTVDEMFLKAFREHILDNRVYPSLPPVEQCIGCMQNAAQVKLVKNCDSSSPCMTCACRPLWCIDCMGRWYASRQDRTRPETWLSGNAPCPMCRAKFCMLDISVLASS